MFWNPKESDKMRPQAVLFHLHELLRSHRQVRRVVSEALYLCWPRTVLRREAPVFRIAKLAKTHGSGNHRERWDGGGGGGGWLRADWMGLELVC